MYVQSLMDKIMAYSFLYTYFFKFNFGIYFLLFFSNKMSKYLIINRVGSLDQ